MRHLRLLQSTPVILASIVGGVLVGIFFKGFAGALEQVGDLYLAFLTMCAIPIMATALVSSLARAFLTRQAGLFLKGAVLVFVVAMVIVSALALLLGLVGRPGSGLPESSREVFGQILIESLVVPTEDAAERPSVASFFLEMIPANAFRAFMEGNALQILFISITFGIVLGLIPSKTSYSMIDHLELTSQVFQDAIGYALYTLPFALFAIMAGQVAQIGMDMMLAMAKFIVLVHIAGLLVMLGSAAVISLKLHISPLVHLRALRETLVIAFGTRSSLTAMPAMLKAF